MPLFACSKCNAVENTALGAYWIESLNGDPVLCSECHTGEWHGKFPKEDAAGWQTDEKLGEPFIRRPDELTPADRLSEREKG